MRLLGKLFLSAFAVFITAWMLPGVHLDSFLAAVLVTIILGLLNFTIKPLLIILTIPVTIFTLGFFLLVINAFIIYLADEIVSGFTVDGFWWAVLFSIVLSVVNSLLSGFDQPPTRKNES